MTDIEQGAPLIDDKAAQGATATESLRRVSGEIGELLATARIAQGVSVHEIAARLKVSAAKLEAIEAGNLGALPDLTFGKAVIRSYAKQLGIDVNGQLERLRQLEPTSTVGLRHEGGLGESFDGHRGPRRLPVEPRILALAGLALLAIAVVYFVMQAEDRRIDAANGPAAEASQVAVDASVALANAVAAPVESVAEPMSSESQASMPASSVLADGGVAGSRQTAVPADVGLEASAVMLAAVDPAVSPLRLRFSEDCWVEVRDRNGKLLASQLGRAGGELAVDGAAPLRVLVGNVRGLESAEFRGSRVQVRAPEGTNVARLTLP